MRAKGTFDPKGGYSFNADLAITVLTFVAIATFVASSLPQHNCFRLNKLSTLQFSFRNELSTATIAKAVIIATATIAKAVIISTAMRIAKAVIRLASSTTIA